LVWTPQLPIPAPVAARPRDERGYPVPAITPWQDGRPMFAATGTGRTYLCAVERRCSVCGTPMEPGPVWRVVAGAEADAIEAAIASGEPYRNLATTVEAPGHRSCMLFAAIACPYLGNPTARRGQEAVAAELVAARGDKRGAGGAVVGFERVEFRYLNEVMLFRFAGVCEFRRHEHGDDHLDELTRAVAGEPPAAPCPDYLLSDESAAQARFASYL
jgi:hypothetical protein